MNGNTCHVRYKVQDPGANGLCGRFESSILISAEGYLQQKHVLYRHVLEHLCKTPVTRCPIYFSRIDPLTESARLLQVQFTPDPHLARVNYAMRYLTIVRRTG